MKKYFLTWAIVLLTTISSFAGNKEGINDKVSQSFQKEFSNATEVSWQTNKEFAKATFKLNGQVMFAYFDETGVLLGMTKNILSTNLPISLLTELKKNYSQYWITDLFEMSKQSNTSYFITLESADCTIVLKSDGSSGWRVYKKEKKIMA